MRKVPMLIHVPEPLKAKLDALRHQGTTTSGLVRWLLEQHFKQDSSPDQKGG